MARTQRFHHNVPQTIEQAKNWCGWDNKERLDYLRNRSRASNYTHQPEVRARIFGRDGYKCVRCGIPDDLTIDHIIAVCRGGNNDDNNLQTLCRSCNSGKLN